MVGLLYDVHGNLPALEAVLEDARGLEVGRWIVGGDVALFGAWPAETVARLRELEQASWLRGNCDRWLVERPDAPPAGPAAERCVAELGEELAGELAALPPALPEGPTLFCHASAASDMRSFLPDPADDEAELLEQVPEDVRRLVFGHTHLPFHRAAAGRAGLELINPGSVGMPLDGDPRAAWAVLRDDGHVEHRRVDYDHERAAAAVAGRFGDGEWTRIIGARIRNARFDGG